MARTYQYRNVQVLEDGSLKGEHDFGCGRWISFSANPELLRIRTALDLHAKELDGPIWDLQDGYGVAGYTPEQGWDWSGIRDSSPETIAAMFALASEYVTDERMNEILGI